MSYTRAITETITWIGGDDRRISLFENAFPVPLGMSYNSYLLLDAQTVLFDTVDRAVADLFFENLAERLQGRSLDYAVVCHVEPDHAATLTELVRRYPQVKILCTDKAAQMLRQFFPGQLAHGIQTVADGETLCTGAHTLRFVHAPMIHWPEVMMVYEEAEQVLFSADAFGTFGALGGRMFADEFEFQSELVPEARRYYANIVGKYGDQVQTALGKLESLPIRMICPLHGPVWRKKLADILNLYQKWSTYTPEVQGVLVAYASVYGNTERVAQQLAGRFSEAGQKVALYDVSAVHPSYLVAEAFRYSHLVLASTTYNAGIFVNMEQFLRQLVHHNLQNRTVALVENGSWAPESGRLMRSLLSECKNMTVLPQTVQLRSALQPDQADQVAALAAAVLETMKPAPRVEHHGEAIETAALFKLSYGLFVLTARENGKDNGCIINTVTQLTENPMRFTIAVNKANYTHDMILHTGVFNVSVLSDSVPFAVFQRFGFQSGRTADKFAGCTEARSANGLRYWPEHTNAILSGKVISSQDYGSHTLFVAEITEAKVLSTEPSVTYADYFARIKPQPVAKPQQTKKKGFVCKICGYIYEGETLPPDFICPLCKHGAQDFEPLS